VDPAAAHRDNRPTTDRGHAMSKKGPRTLEGIRIAVEAGGVAGLYAGWLLAGIGADVTMRYNSRGPAAHAGLVRWLLRPTKAPAADATLTSLAAANDVVLIDAGMQYDATVREQVEAAKAAGDSSLVA